MMPDLEFFIVAEGVSVDQGTNRLSLFNIVEGLQMAPLGSEAPPPQSATPMLAIGHLVAVSTWNISAADMGQTFSVALRLHPPGNDAAPRDLGTLQFQADRTRQRIMQTMVGLPFTGPGDWRFEVRLDDRHAAYHTVSIQALAEAQAALA